MERVIVSRHPATVEFIRRELPEFANAPVLATATPEDVAGKEVAGNLPLDLARHAHTVHAVCFSGTPPRGQEYGLEEMDAAGAHIESFRVLPDEGQQEEIVNLVVTAYRAGYDDGAQTSGWGPAVHRASEFVSRARALCRALGL